MTSLEDVARTIAAMSTQNGLNAAWAWTGDDLDIEFTGPRGRPGPRLTLRRDARRQTIALLDGKRFATWPERADAVPWGRFWRAVREAAAPRRTPSHERTR